MNGNTIIRDMVRLGLSTPDSFVPYHPRVRDRDDVSALLCSRCGAIVLSSNTHIDTRDYQQRETLEYWNREAAAGADRAALLRGTFEDDSRRAQMLAPLLRGKSWLDVGTGLGGVLDLAGSMAGQVVAIEPQAGPQASLKAAGYRVVGDIDELENEIFDVITLFHVFEHINEPTAFLDKVRSRMAPGGRLIMEIPHARDALLTLYKCEAFKGFTLWSEHLILHTRETVTRFLQAAGFGRITIEGVQRYPLSNHLYWLAAGKPGGHVAWGHLNDPQLAASYAATLARLDSTDTLMIHASC